MQDNLYKLEGTVTISDDKRDEFNRKVLEVLFKGGIRKTEEIIVNGKPLTVVHKAEADSDGIVSFDYSIFEKKKREISTFNTYTGELSVADSGYQEYGVIMHLIMVLQQSYSSSVCFLTYKGKLLRIQRYLDVLDTILGENTDCVHGADAWNCMHIDGYRDNVKGLEGKGNVSKTRKPYPLYNIIRRESEDEFIEFWNGDNLNLSEKLTNRISEWKKSFEKTEADYHFDMESELYRILSEMEKDWSCRYADREFVEEFLNHKTDERYLNLLRILGELLDEGTELFPELTKRQAIDWIIRRSRDKHDAVMMSAFVSLMTNYAQRIRIFGL